MARADRLTARDLESNIDDNFAVAALCRGARLGRMNTITDPALPPAAEMRSAFLAGDGSYDGVFFTAVKTTGIFCLPSCPARKPKPENVEFFASAREALFNGYRACRSCRPLDLPGTVPGPIRKLMDLIEADPQRRWRDADLRARGLSPGRLRRWFQRHFEMSFHAYARARRIGQALTAMRGGRDVTGTALDHGFDSLSGFNDAVKRLTGKPPRRSGELEAITVKRLVTPLGAMVAGATAAGICLLEFSDRRALERQVDGLIRRLDGVLVPGDGALLRALEEELEAYFAGRLKAFGVPLAPLGTPFQRTVWSSLVEIPYGETVSYGQLAARLKRPGASRAVARANGDNRIAILIPCHRVIGADGHLTGYGGGLWRKRRLLELEGASIPPVQPSLIDG